MAQNYFSIVTNIGRNKLALSAAGGAAVTITHFAVGDGNGAEVNPTAASTALVREVWRTPVESVVIDPLNPSAVLVTSIIPTAVGGWWMREFGIFDVDGDMVAVAKPVSQYKPTALEGQLEDIRYEFQIIIGETANVTMLVDPSVLLASRAWVESRKVPVVQLSLTPWVPVKSMTITAPPANPAAWDTYIIPAGATGAWTGHAQKLAEWNGQAWNIVTPPDGHGISLPDGRIFERVGGSYVEKPALDVQSGKWGYAIAGGTADALTATLVPAPSAYVAGMVFAVRINSNNTGPATINFNGLGVKPVVRGDGSPLQKDDLVAGQVASLMYDGTAFQVDGLKTSQTPPRNMTAYTVAGTYSFVAPAGVYKLYGICVAGGGGAGGMGIYTNGQPFPAGAGGAGGFSEGWIDVTPGQSIAVIVGAGGAGGQSVASNTAGTYGQNGGYGGSTSIGGLLSATGGAGGGAASGGGGEGGKGVGGQINGIGGMGQDGGGGRTPNVGGSGGTSRMGGGGRAATEYAAIVCDGKAAGSGGGAVYAGWQSQAKGKGGVGATGIAILQY